jgi:hypothetical protein
MKKIVFAVVVLMLAAPAGASQVFITCAQVPNEPNIIISYNDEYNPGNPVRCFGLDLQLDNAETVLEVECLSADYYVYPGQFSYDGQTPSFGTCDCTGKAGALPGPNGVTIEMCSLYADDDPDHNEPPAASGPLVRVKVSGECCISITPNALRGGVVLEDNAVVEPNVPGPNDCCVSGLDCFPKTDPKYAQWVTQGKPEAWCCTNQRNGDATGDGQCNVFDLMRLKLAVGGTYPNAPYDCRADFTHDGNVNVFDLMTLKLNVGTNWGFTCASEGYNPDDCGNCGAGACP